MSQGYGLSQIVIRNKSRLVAQGYFQVEGVYFDETFAPVARLGLILKTLNLFFLGFIERLSSENHALILGSVPLFLPYNKEKFPL